MKCFYCHTKPSFTCEHKCGYFVCGRHNSHIHRHDLSSLTRMRFDDFFMENTGPHLDVKKIYNIDHMEIDRWFHELVESNLHPEWFLQFISMIVKNLRHISYSEFKDRLLRVARDAVDHVKATAPTRVYLVVAGNTYKSNAWVSLLCWPILRSVVTDVVGSFLDIPIDDIEGACVLVPDDMSYSGTQILRDIWEERDEYDLLFETDEEKPLRLPLLDSYVLLVPFIGTAALKWAKSYEGVRIMENTEVILDIDSLWNQVTLHFDDYRGDIWEVLRKGYYKKLYKFVPGQCCVYFDHKHAVWVSTTANLFYALWVLNEDSTVKGPWFAIEGHKPVPWKSSRTIEEAWATVEPENEATAHPPSFYKYLTYTFRGKPMEDRETRLIDIISPEGTR